MKFFPFVLLSIAVLAVSCTKCVECEIRLKQSQEVIDNVDELCGTNKKIAEEEDRMRAEYTCIECEVITGFGPVTSGVVCGDLAFTDSVEADWEQGAFDLGTTADCFYYRDTANVLCVLK